MAVARKCDRCGTFYDIPKVGEISGIFWMYGVETVGGPRDLCPKCTDELSDWMEGGNLNALHGEGCSGLETVGSEEAEETVCEAGDSVGGGVKKQNPPTCPMYPKKSPRSFLIRSKTK